MVDCVIPSRSLSMFQSDAYTPRSMRSITYKYQLRSSLESVLVMSTNDESCDTNDLEECRSSGFKGRDWRHKWGVSLLLLIVSLSTIIYPCFANRMAQNISGAAYGICRWDGRLFDLAKARMAQSCRLNTWTGFQEKHSHLPCRLHSGLSSIGIKPLETRISCAMIVMQKEIIFMRGGHDPIVLSTAESGRVILRANMVLDLDIVVESPWCENR